MNDLLLIDGYNIIHSWSELKELLKTFNYEAARTRLIDIMCDFSAQKNYDTVIVFDAHLKKGSLHSEESYPPLKVVYTGENITADQYIERIVSQQDKRLRNVYVATSDALEQTIVFGKGGARLSARELLRMVHEGKESQRKTLDKPIGKNTIASTLNEDTLRRLDEIIKGIRLEE